MRAALETLIGTFQGEIVQPGADGYEAAAATVLTAGHPAVVLRPAGVADVQAAVRFAAEAGLPMAVRGGGHSFPGFGTNEGGIVIDLSPLAAVELIGDPQRRLARIGGGATWGAVAAALAPHHLAISSGDTRGVGVGGLTLSGGIGWKVRKYGLALDALTGVEVVTADGEVLHASEKENTELFWALRGGGGNLGIVTAFDFVVHPTTEVFHGRIAFPAAEAQDVLQGWADYMRTASEDLTSIVAFANPFAGGPDAPVEVFVAVDDADADHAAAVLDPIRRLGTVIADEVELKPYEDLLVDGLTPPPGIRLTARSAFVERESVAATLRILAEVGAAPQSPIIAVRSVGGAVAQVSDDATAYAYRSAELMIVTTSAGPAPVLEATRPALDAIWDRLAPHVVGAYANFLSDATESDVAAVFPEKTYQRLAAVKRKYDPANLFSGNHNVKPL
ncbi:FAD-binding oxidoreductase [Catenulispora subtropica]|uniref:FAD-binding oxidoreductase n=1 Tax=Catenulispora subtropica TaxID=450798 RepID=A0ABN2SRT4_9ACTN